MSLLSSIRPLPLLLLSKNVAVGDWIVDGACDSPPCAVPIGGITISSSLCLLAPPLTRVLLREWCLLGWRWLCITMLPCPVPEPMMGLLMSPTGLRTLDDDGLRMLRAVGVEIFQLQYRNLLNPGRDDDAWELEPLLGGKDEGDGYLDREVHSDLNGGRQPTQTAATRSHTSAEALVWAVGREWGRNVDTYRRWIQ